MTMTMEKDDDYQIHQSLGSSSNKDCPICLEICVDPQTLKPCGHTFCLYCVQKWSRYQRHLSSHNSNRRVSPITDTTASTTADSSTTNSTNSPSQSQTQTRTVMAETTGTENNNNVGREDSDVLPTPSSIISTTDVVNNNDAEQVNAPASLQPGAVVSNNSNVNVIPTAFEDVLLPSTGNDVNQVNSPALTSSQPQPVVPVTHAASSIEDMILPSTDGGNDNDVDRVDAPVSAPTLPRPVATVTNVTTTTAAFAATCPTCRMVIQDYALDTGLEKHLLANYEESYLQRQKDIAEERETTLLDITFLESQATAEDVGEFFNDYNNYYYYNTRQLNSEIRPKRLLIAAILALLYSGVSFLTEWTIILILCLILLMLPFMSKNYTTRMRYMDRILWLFGKLTSCCYCCSDVVSVTNKRPNWVEMTTFYALTFLLALVHFMILKYGFGKASWI